MATRSPQDWLQPDEEVLADAGRHPLSVLDGALAATLILGGLVAASWFVTRFFPVLDTWALVVSVLAVVLWLGILVALYWRVRTSRYVLSSDRVYRSHGKLRFILVQTTYDKVTDLHVHQSLFGRIWDFGTITVQTAGTGLAMQGVRDPTEMKKRLESARRAFIAKLLEEHGLERQAEQRAAELADEEAVAEGEWKPVPSGGAPAEDAVLWRGGPVAFTLVPASLSAGVMMLIGAGLAFGGVGGEQGGFGLFGFVLLFFGLVSLVQAFIQYRFTRYEVRPWGVVVTSGWLSRRRAETTFDKVTDVSTYQNFLGRLLDYGNIKINTAGSNQAPVNFNGLAHPERVKAAIDAARRERTERRRQR